MFPLLKTKLALWLLFHCLRHLKSSSKVESNAVDFLLRFYFFSRQWNVDLSPTISIGCGKIKENHSRWSDHLPQEL